MVKIKLTMGIFIPSFLPFYKLAAIIGTYFDFYLDFGIKTALKF
jgi:hypothetical protein